jgi:hypothetical protein
MMTVVARKDLKYGDLFTHRADCSRIFKVTGVFNCKEVYSNGELSSYALLISEDYPIFLLNKKQTKSNKPIWF